MEHRLELEVDDDGFVALVAPEDYLGFVDEDWELDALLAHLAEQMDRESLFIAYPGPDDANGALVFGAEPPVSAGRAASGIVRVGEAGLWLTDYTQLTMAAQFPDESPIGRSSQRLDLAPGRYLLALHEDAEGESAFVLTATPAGHDAVVRQTGVPWFE